MKEVPQVPQSNNVVFIDDNPIKSISIFGILIDFIMDALTRQNAPKTHHINLRFIMPVISPRHSTANNPIHSGFEKAMESAQKRYSKACEDWENLEDHIQFNPVDSSEIFLGDNIYHSPKETVAYANKINHALPENTVALMDLILFPYGLFPYFVSDSCRLVNEQYILSHILCEMIQGKNIPLWMISNYDGNTHNADQWYKVYEQRKAEQCHPYEAPKLFYRQEIDGNAYADERFYQQILDTLFA